MTKPSCLIDIKDALPNAYWPQVIYALRQDLIVWKAIDNQGFRKQAISCLGNHPQNWTPARLALLAINDEFDLDTLDTTPLADLNPELHQMAVEAYKANTTNAAPDMTLTTAGLLALALREQNRISHSWHNLVQESHWRTVYACLFSMIDKPIQLLHELPTDIIVHTILANPLSSEDQIESLTAITSPYPTQKRLTLLRELGLHRPDLAQIVARHLWLNRTEGEGDYPEKKDHPIFNLPSEFKNAQKTLDQLNSDLLLAEVQFTTGRSEQSASNLHQAWQNAFHLQTSLANQVVQAEASLGNFQKSKEDWEKAQSKPDAPINETASLALIWLEHGHPDEAKAILDEIEYHSEPMVLLALAALSLEEGNRTTAREYALRASESAEKLSRDAQVLLSKHLLELDRPVEATQVLENIRRAHPNCRVTNRLLALSYTASGSFPQAVQAIHLSVAFEPTNTDILRDFARVHEHAGLWPAAKEARLGVIESQDELMIADYQAFAMCSLKLGQPEQAEEACLSVLDQFPEDGVTHALLGQALVEQGKVDEGLESLQKALNSSPENAISWLLMAWFYNQIDKSSEASETLRKGINAAPNQPEIHLALGQHYLLESSHSQALTSLRQAYHLSENLPINERYHLRSRISLPFANTLFELGHAEEALDTLENNFPLPENQVSLLHLQAKILTFLKMSERATPLLAKALMVSPSDAAINLDYAKAQLEANLDPGKAVNALRSLLKNDPKNTEAQAWLAEAYLANGDPANALIEYRKALGTRLSADPYWHPRLSIGLSQAALELDQPETALASLQKNWQTTPQNQLIILQTLAKANKQAHLYEKALLTAKSARDMEPDSMENLIWFADFAQSIQAYNEVIDSLKHAVELSPNRADLYLNLAYIHHEIGDKSEARLIYRKIGDIDPSSIQELQIAANHLLALDSPEDAIVCLKKAVRRCLDNVDEISCTDLVCKLIKAYRYLGMLDESLSVLEEVLSQQKTNLPLLIGKKAEILNEQGHYDDAVAVLQDALVDFPENVQIHIAASRIHYASGNHTKALTHAQKAVVNVANSSTNQDTSSKILAQAADIANACLKVETAREYLQMRPESKELSRDLSYLCLQSEYALESDEEIISAKALTAAMELSPQHPRVLALQARLTLRHGNLENAQNMLQTALANWGDISHRGIMSPAGLLGLSEAALDLNEWNTAVYILREAAEQFSQEPRTQLRLARGLVLRAEFQRFCDTFRVQEHAPGPFATSAFSYQQFERAISAAAHLSDNIKPPADQSRISQWRIRGHAIFQPSEEHTQAIIDLPKTSENIAAHLAAYRYCEEIQADEKFVIGQMESFPEDSQKDTNGSALLMAEVALVLMKSHPELAERAVQHALELTIRQKNPCQPIVYAVQTHIAEQVGNLEAAWASIQNGLSHWENESRWYLWAAEISQVKEEPDYDLAVELLTKATQLEPKYGLHHLRLGQAYLYSENPKAAIPCIEQATRLLSDQAKPWLILAQAYQASGETAQIFPNAERAVELDPSNIEASLLLAESALKINNPDKVVQYCNNTLAIDANHPQALLLMSRALDELNRSEEALQAFDKALETTPKTVTTMLEYADITRRAIGTQAAVDTLDALAYEHPEEVRVLAALAEALADNDQRNPAIKVAQKAIQLNDGSLDASQEAYLQNLLGRLMRHTGQLDQAISYLSMAIQKNPDSVDSYLELGRVYQDRRQYSTAMDSYQQAIALDPENAQAYYQAGQTLKSAKDYAAAEEMLQNAAKLAPDDLSIRRQLGGLVALNLVHNRKENTKLYVE